MSESGGPNAITDGEMEGESCFMIIRDLHGVDMRVVKPYVYEFNFKYRARYKQATSTVEPRGPVNPVMEAAINAKKRRRALQSTLVDDEHVYTMRDLYKDQLFGPQSAVRSLSAEEEEYLTQAIQYSLVKVNGKSISNAEHRLRNGDVIHRIWHRHELPVLYVPVQNMILAETDDYIVVNKPATVPVHPGGEYRLNSLHRMLNNHRPDLRDRLFPVHRLDRLTSGLLVMAKSSANAKKISSYIQNVDGKAMHKTYLAIVKGRFPSTREEAEVFVLSFNSGKGITGSKAFKQQEDVIRIEGMDEQRLKLRVFLAVSGASYRKGKQEGSAAGNDDDAFLKDSSDNGKPSESIFSCLAYDAQQDLSLVKCEPITGRTHQLRIHLSELGFPIANDPEYGGEVHNCVNSPQEIKTFQEEYQRQLAMATMSGVSPYSSQTQTESLAQSICLECAQAVRSIEPVRHRGIFLHSCRIQWIDHNNGGGDQEGCNVVKQDLRAPFPQWALDFRSWSVGELETLLFSSSQ